MSRILCQPKSSNKFHLLNITKTRGWFSSVHQGGGGGGVVQGGLDWIEQK